MFPLIKGFPERSRFMPPSQLTNLAILYQDDFYVAVDKPAGMIVHRGANASDGEPVLLQTLRDQIGRHVYPVHRLDQPTSGVILFGLSSSAAAAMVEQFTQRQVEKYYQALVRGWMHREGCLRIPLIATNEESPAQHSLGEITRQKAETVYSTIRWYEVPACLNIDSSRCFSLVEAYPRTGRWHQIRRHLKHIAHPIIGDYRHGDDRYNRWCEERFGNNRLLLASCYIAFRHPFSGKLTTIRASRGEAFDTLISTLTAFEVPIQTARLPQQPSSQKYESSQSDIWYMNS